MTAQQPLRAFIYDRNSRVINGRLTSTEDQRIENQRLCERNGWIIAGEFSDPGRSASRYAKVARESYERMLNGIREGGCDVLVIWEASRGYRSAETFIQLRNLLEQKGVLLCYNGRTHDMSNRSDRFMTLLDAARAEDEAEGIRDRILRTTRRTAERGRPHGRIPYGYRREYDQETGELLRQVIDEPQAAVIREAAERVASGQSLYRIAKDFASRGIPAPGGPDYEWSMLSVRNILMRPSNAGQRQHQGVVVGAAKWAPILDEELFYTVTGILQDPARRTQRDSTVKHLLSGLMLCGPCFDEGIEQITRPRNAGGAKSYVCIRCFRSGVRLGLAEEYVQHTILAYVERPEFAAALSVRTGDDDAATALAEAKALEIQLEEGRRLASTFKDGRFQLSAVSLAKMEQELLPRIEAARTRAQDPGVPPVLRLLASAGPGVGDVWEQLDVTEKRTALRGLVRIRLNRAGRGVRAIRPGRFTFD
ncbi:MAG TPA: recombinase family protein, partial [Actinocrinis sp.]|uniref:recombinase family protein n=1 Tax=Actinocrinis sp. TaxID=1920516 RepID=UPI002D464388